MAKNVASASQSEVYGPFEKCIYCGSNGNGKPLTKEHAIPFALDGPYILAKASCHACSEITRKIEEINLKGVHSNFGAIRPLLGYATRNRKERQRSGKSQITVRSSAAIIHKTVPIEQRPFLLALPSLGEPGILMGAPVGAPFQYNLNGLSQDPSAIAEAHGGAVSFTYKFDIWAFLRMLAKIAHCLGVMKFGLGSFEPLLPDLILGKNMKLAGHLVGQSRRVQHADIPELTTIPDVDRRHQLQLKVFHDVNLLVAGIRLFSVFRTSPTYCVVIGRMKISAAELSRRELLKPNPS